MRLGAAGCRLFGVVLALHCHLQWQKSAASASFSAGVKFGTDDLNDFLKPELKCVLPVSGAVRARPPGSVGAPIHAESATGTSSLRVPKASASSALGSNRTGERVKKRRRRTRQHLPPTEVVARVTLSDCLACSGCVTSAEEILLDRHSTSLLVSAAANSSLFCVVSLSPQATASLAAASKLSFDDTGNSVHRVRN